MLFDRPAATPEGCFTVKEPRSTRRCFLVSMAISFSRPAQFTRIGTNLTTEARRHGEEQRKNLPQICADDRGSRKCKLKLSRIGLTTHNTDLHRPKKSAILRSPGHARCRRSPRSTLSLLPFFRVSKVFSLPLCLRGENCFSHHARCRRFPMLAISFWPAPRRMSRW